VRDADAKRSWLSLQGVVLAPVAHLFPQYDHFFEKSLCEHSFHMEQSAPDAAPAKDISTVEEAKKEEAAAASDGTDKIYIPKGVLKFLISTFMFQKISFSHQTWRPSIFSWPFLHRGSSIFASRGPILHI
jgi:hypothetical protein